MDFSHLLWFEITKLIFSISFIYIFYSFIFLPFSIIDDIFLILFADSQTVPTLCELSARCVASHIPFELVEQVYPPVPEQLQLRIAFWSFPDNEEDIRLYSCLANGSADEFQRGEHLFRSRSVKEPLQIGQFLSKFTLLPANYFFCHRISLGKQTKNLLFESSDWNPLNMRNIKIYKPQEFPFWTFYIIF